jgi:hypothetical protein
MEKKSSKMQFLLEATWEQTETQKIIEEKNIPMVEQQ